jgi:RNA polymerase sigma-70 factor (ECF subfamily)
MLLSGLPSLAELVEQHSRALFAYAYRLSGNAADAEDLTQEAFLVAQQKLHQLREGSAALGWLLAVVRSCFCHSLRRKQPATTEFDLNESALVASDERQWIDQEHLQHNLQQLPDEFRVVVLMFYFEELSYKQIAEQLNLPIGTVMSRLSRAKIQLRGSLQTPAPPQLSTPHKHSPESRPHFHV